LRRSTKRPALGYCRSLLTLSIFALGLAAFSTTTAWAEIVDTFYIPGAGDSVCYIRHLNEAALARSGGQLEGPADWPQYQGNAQHIGYNPTDESVPPLTFRWEHLLISGPISPVAIVGNRVIATPWYPGPSVPNGAFLWCFDIETGDTLWWGSFGGADYMSQATYEAGLVYVAMFTSWFYVAAVEIETGALVWMSPYREQDSHSLAATVYQGRVFNAGNFYGGMHAFNAVTGEELWKIRYVAEDEWTPAVYLDRTYAFEARRLYVNNVATGDSIYYFRPDTLDTDFSRGALGQGNAPLLDTTNMLLYLTEDSGLYCIDVSSDPKIVWKHKDEGIYFRVMPVLYDTLLIAMTKPNLSVYHALTGQLLWTFDGYESFAYNYPPVVSNGYVYVSSPDRVYAIDINTHQAAWTMDSDGGFVSIGNGCLCVSTHEGRLYCYGSPSTDVADYPELNLPSGYMLEQNYPNPFNPTTQISFTLPRRTDIRLEIFDPTGRLVETLAEGSYPAGEYSVEWNGTDHASGVYLYRLTAGDQVESKKMVLVK